MSVAPLVSKLTSARGTPLAATCTNTTCLWSASCLTTWSLRPWPVVTVSITTEVLSHSNDVEVWWHRLALICAMTHTTFMGLNPTLWQQHPSYSPLPHCECTEPEQLDFTSSQTVLLYPWADMLLVMNQDVKDMKKHRSAHCWLACCLSAYQSVIYMTKHRH